MFAIYIKEEERRGRGKGEVILSKNHSFKRLSASLFRIKTENRLKKVSSHNPVEMTKGTFRQVEIMVK